MAYSTTELRDLIQVACDEENIPTACRSRIAQNLPGRLPNRVGGFREGELTLALVRQTLQRLIASDASYLSSGKTPDPLTRLREHNRRIHG